MKNVLVAGASGYLGKYVVREFKEKGWWVRTIARNIHKLHGITDSIDDSKVGLLTDQKSLKGICEDIDVVFSSVGITKQRDGLTYMDVDFQANKNLLEEAKRAGVKKFIYISVFGADELKHLKAIQAKLNFEDELKNSGLDYTIIYPNGFFSDLLEYLEMAKKGRGYVFGNGNNKINPIHGKDLAEVCVNAAVSNFKTIDVGGPDTFTHNEILELAFNTVGKELKISRIPLWIRNLLLSLLKTFTSVKTYGPLEFFMTVLSKDMIAPCYGKEKLEVYLNGNYNKL